MDHTGNLGGRNWWVPAAREMGGLSPSSTTTGGGGFSNGSNTQGIQFRSPLDARRAAKGQLSQAEYPDGYLGNIIDRRSDRLISAIKDRLTPQSTQRGVHKASIIDQRQYFWNEDMSFDQGLKREARAQAVVSDDGMVTYNVQRNAPHGIPITKLVNDGKTPPRVDGGPPAQATMIQDPLQVTHFYKMIPSYKTAGVS